MQQEDIVEKIKERIRAKSKSSDEEVKDLIDACKKDLEMKGVYGDEADPIYYQAIVLYCKAHYGYDEDSSHRLMPGGYQSIFKEETKHDRKRQETGNHQRVWKKRG